MPSCRRAWDGTTRSPWLYAANALSQFRSCCARVRSCQVDRSTDRQITGERNWRRSAKVCCSASAVGDLHSDTPSPHFLPLLGLACGLCLPDLRARYTCACSPLLSHAATIDALHPTGSAAHNRMVARIAGFLASSEGATCARATDSPQFCLSGCAGAWVATLAGAWVGTARIKDPKVPADRSP
jgi:hypothetical protein